jgi:hypothetical protein
LVPEPLALILQVDFEGDTLAAVAALEEQKAALLYFSRQLQTKYTRCMVRERLGVLEHSVQLRHVKAVARAFRVWSLDTSCARVAVRKVARLPRLCVWGRGEAG